MPKRIVICCDGTWNTPDQVDGGEICPSNVVKIGRALMPTAPDGTVQTVYYDEGVGTGTGLDRWTGGAFGTGLEKNVQDAYRFIVHNYEPGDDLYFFGFSRGAYTVRSTAGLIRNCGILRRIHAEKFTEAYDRYRSGSDENRPDAPRSVRFREEHSWAPTTKIKFIGVWDTVGALGIPLRSVRFLPVKRHQFHDVTLSRSVENAFHALAIDERRKVFQPAIWKVQERGGQRVEQTWFTGVHTNVGGGYKSCKLANVTLAWMIERAEECGLAFDQAFVRDAIDPKADGDLRNSKVGMYRFFRDHHRSIGDVSAVTESVHPSVVERHERAPDEYAPPMLVRYLKKRIPA